MEMEYRHISLEEVESRLAKHKLWVADPSKGEQAKFDGCDLQHVSFEGRDLENVDFSNSNQRRK